ASTLSEILPLFMLGVTLTSPGRFDTDTVTGLPSASLAVPMMATVAVGVPRATVTPPVMFKVGAVLVEVMVKLASEISKKMFPTASTLMRAWVVATLAVFGMVTLAEPLFGTLAASTNGKVFPPSVDNVIFTFAQLTGA